MKEINFCFTNIPNPEPPTRINATELSAMLSHIGALLFTVSKSNIDSKVKKARFETMLNVKSEL